MEKQRSIDYYILYDTIFDAKQRQVVISALTRKDAIDRFFAENPQGLIIQIKKYSNALD
jgi:5,10-methenyltetrahydromethanopterin hydrogenase